MTEPRPRAAAAAAAVRRRSSAPAAAHRARPTQPFPSRCPARRPGDDIDHVHGPAARPGRAVRFAGRATSPNPFVRYRDAVPRLPRGPGAGWPDDRYVALVERLDAAVAAVDGHGFRVTPFAPERRAQRPRSGFVRRGRRLGQGRDRQRLGLAQGAPPVRASCSSCRRGASRRGARPRPAAARSRSPSCGNAALAAAVVARAAGRRLDVFVPPDADAVVVARLRALGAPASGLRARARASAGDPTYHRLLRAIAARRHPVHLPGQPERPRDRGRRDARLGDRRRASARRRPRASTGSSSRSAAARSRSSVIAGPSTRPGGSARSTRCRGSTPSRPAARGPAGARLRARAPRGVGGRRTDSTSALADAARHRSAFMWPWETEPRSVAHGILDDETYDWLAVVRAMLATGGAADRRRRGHPRRRPTRSPARRPASTPTTPARPAWPASSSSSATASVRPDETVAVLFTGVSAPAAPTPGVTAPVPRTVGTEHAP